MSEQITECYA